MIFYKKLPRKLNIPRKKDIFLCGILMFSFCYELPLFIITRYDRFNPRLFDVVLLIALFATKWRRNTGNAIVRAWEYLTLSFLFAGIISFFFLVPRYYGYYSIFYSVKYVEAMFAIWILTGFEWRRSHIDLLLKYFCVGLILAGIVGFLQYWGLFPTDRFLPTGEKINVQQSTILATFGPTYFHSGVMGAIGSVIALALLLNKSINKYFFMCAYGAGLFLALFSGSRSAFGLAVFINIFLLISRIKYIAVLVLLTLLLMSSTFIQNFLYQESLTFQRMNTSGQSSFSARIDKNYIDVYEEYWDEHGLQLLLFGGGFYVVPMHGKYRVGYGNHNIHFFPLEQAGLLGFFAALFFWITIIKYGFRKIKGFYGRSAFGIGLGLIIIGWVGQIFYFGFGTENMVVFQVSILALFLGHGFASRQNMQIPIRPNKLNIEQN